MTTYEALPLKINDSNGSPKQLTSYAEIYAEISKYQKLAIKAREKTMKTKNQVGQIKKRITRVQEQRQILKDQKEAIQKNLQTNHTNKNNNNHNNYDSQFYNYNPIRNPSQELSASSYSNRGRDRSFKIRKPSPSNSAYRKNQELRDILDYKGYREGASSRFNQDTDGQKYDMKYDDYSKNDRRKKINRIEDSIHIPDPINPYLQQESNQRLRNPKEKRSSNNSWDPNYFNNDDKISQGRQRDRESSQSIENRYNQQIDPSIQREPPSHTRNYLNKLIQGKKKAYRKQGMMRLKLKPNYRQNMPIYNNSSIPLKESTSIDMKNRNLVKERKLRPSSVSSYISSRSSIKRSRDQSTTKDKIDEDLNKKDSRPKSVSSTQKISRKSSRVNSRKMSMKSSSRNHLDIEHKENKRISYKSSDMSVALDKVENSMQISGAKKDSLLSPKMNLESQSFDEKYKKNIDAIKGKELTFNNEKQHFLNPYNYSLDPAQIIDSNLKNPSESKLGDILIEQNDKQEIPILNWNSSEGELYYKNQLDLKNRELGEFEESSPIKQTKKQEKPPQRLNTPITGDVRYKQPSQKMIRMSNKQKMIVRRFEDFFHKHAIDVKPLDMKSREIRKYIRGSKSRLPGDPSSQSKLKSGASGGSMRNQRQVLDPMISPRSSKGESDSKVQTRSLQKIGNYSEKSIASNIKLPRPANTNSNRSKSKESRIKDIQPLSQKSLKSQKNLPIPITEANNSLKGVSGVQVSPELLEKTEFLEMDKISSKANNLLINTTFQPKESSSTLKDNKTLENSPSKFDKNSQKSEESLFEEMKLSDIQFKKGTLKSNLGASLHNKSSLGTDRTPQIGSLESLSRNNTNLENSSVISLQQKMTDMDDIEDPLDTLTPFGDNEQEKDNKILRIKNEEEITKKEELFDDIANELFQKESKTNLQESSVERGEEANEIKFDDIDGGFTFQEDKGNKTNGDIDRGDLEEDVLDDDVMIDIVDDLENAQEESPYQREENILMNEGVCEPIEIFKMDFQEVAQFKRPQIVQCFDQIGDQNFCKNEIFEKFEFQRQEIELKQEDLNQNRITLEDENEIREFVKSELNTFEEQNFREEKKLKILKNEKIEEIIEEDEDEEGYKDNNSHQDIKEAIKIDDKSLGNLSVSQSKIISESEKNDFKNSSTNSLANKNTASDPLLEPFTSNINNKYQESENSKVTWYAKQELQKIFEKVIQKIKLDIKKTDIYFTIREEDEDEEDDENNESNNQIEEDYELELDSQQSQDDEELLSNFIQNSLSHLLDSSTVKLSEQNNETKIFEEIRQFVDKELKDLEYRHILNDTRMEYQKPNQNIDQIIKEEDEEEENNDNSTPVEKFGVQSSPQIKRDREDKNEEESSIRRLSMQLLKMSEDKLFNDLLQDKIEENVGLGSLKSLNTIRNGTIDEDIDEEEYLNRSFNDSGGQDNNSFIDKNNRQSLDSLKSFNENEIDKFISDELDYLSSRLIRDIYPSEKPRNLNKEGEEYPKLDTPTNTNRFTSNTNGATNRRLTLQDPSTLKMPAIEENNDNESLGQTTIQENESIEDLMDNNRFEKLGGSLDMDEDIDDEVGMDKDVNKDEEHENNLSISEDINNQIGDQEIIEEIKGEDFNGENGDQDNLDSIADEIDVGDNQEQSIKLEEKDDGEDDNVQFDDMNQKEVDEMWDEEF